jgi:hypothetical protein
MTAFRGLSSFPPALLLLGRSSKGEGARFKSLHTLDLALDPVTDAGLK